jgi:RNA polymerase sigma-70 factor (ECF subfamily)
VLILSRYQDLKYEEIAQMMDCEVSTIKVRVHRALQELREVFQALESGKLVRKPGTRGSGAWPSSGSLQ